MNWAKLGEWGGLLGLWVTGLSGWGRAYQKEARPTTEMSIDLKILTSRFADHRAPRTRSCTCTYGRRRRGVIFRFCAIESTHA